MLVLCKKLVKSIWCSHNLYTFNFLNFFYPFYKYPDSKIFCKVVWLHVLRRTQNVRILTFIIFFDGKLISIIIKFMSKRYIRLIKKASQFAPRLLIMFKVNNKGNRYLKQKHQDDDISLDQIHRTSLVLLLLIWNNFFPVRVFHRVFLTKFVHLQGRVYDPLKHLWWNLLRK